MATVGSGNVGALYGALSAAFVVTLWLATFHRRFCLSIVNTSKVTAYGVYVSVGEALRRHYWYVLCQVLGFHGGNSDDSRRLWNRRVKTSFLRTLGVLSADQDADIDAVPQQQLDRHQLLVTHSCRAVFYFIVKSLLDRAKERTGKPHIKILTCSVQFGSFYRLLRGMEKSLACSIEFLEVDLDPNDWTLDCSTVNEDDVRTCDVIMVQHLFGVPFRQDKFWEWAAKYDLPVIEDDVQSGSVFGRYKGDPRSDVLMFSGGLDKTPACFGGGFGYFRRTKHGNDLYASCRRLYEQCPLDTAGARLVAVFNQTVHTAIAKNTLGFNNLMGLLAYVMVSERGESVQWYKMSLKVRKNKSITPFQHAESGFLRHPCVAHLRSMYHGLSKKQQYARIAREEVRRRKVLLRHIPDRYHAKLFPWWTPSVLQQHEDNLGISEFSWVNPCFSKDRLDMCAYLNDNNIVCLINTTWETHTESKMPVGKEVNDSLVYLPNINELNNDSSIVNLAKVLTKYCEECGQPKTAKIKSL